MASDNFLILMGNTLPGTLRLPNGVVYIAVYGNSSFLLKKKKNTHLEQCACEVVHVFNYMHTLGFVTGIYKYVC